MSLLSFKEFCNEILYKPGNKYNSKFNSPENTDLSKLKPIYEGKKYKLFDVSLNLFDYFILTDNELRVLFYIQYMKTKNTYILAGRENLSNEKRLFFKVIYTLLFLGYILKEDFQHNDLSIKAIKKLINSNIITVLYDNKDITQDIIDNNFNDNDKSKTFQYKMNIGNKDPKYAKEILEARHLMLADNFFDVVDDYINNTEM